MSNHGTFAWNHGNKYIECTVGCFPSEQQWKVKVNRIPQLKNATILVVTGTGCGKYPKNICMYIYINIYMHIIISYLYLTLTNAQITLQLPFCWRLEHPHIVKMYECFEERQSLWLVSGTRSSIAESEERWNGENGERSWIDDAMLQLFSKERCEILGS